MCILLAAFHIAHDISWRFYPCDVADAPEQTMWLACMYCVSLLEAYVISYLIQGPEMTNPCCKVWLDGARARPVDDRHDRPLGCTLVRPLALGTRQLLSHGICQLSTDCPLLNLVAYQRCMFSLTRMLSPEFSAIAPHVRDGTWQTLSVSELQKNLSTGHPACLVAYSWYNLAEAMQSTSREWKHD